MSAEERLVRRNLAFALVTENEYSTAWPHVQRLLAEGEDAWWLHLSAAQICLYRLADYECVETGARRALELRPDNARGYMLLGQMAEELGDQERAIEHYRDSLERRGSQAEVATRLAGLLADTGELDPAIAVMEAVQRRHPRDARIMLTFARLVEGSDVERAEMLYERAVTYHEEPAVALGHLMRFYERQARSVEAEAVGQRINALIQQRHLRPIR